MLVGWPRLSTSCELYGPVRFEDEVELRLRVVKLGDKSFSYEVDFLVNGRPVALGKTTSVCCVLEGGHVVIEGETHILRNHEQMASLYLGGAME